MNYVQCLKHNYVKEQNMWDKEHNCYHHKMTSFISIIQSDGVPSQTKFFHPLIKLHFFQSLKIEEQNLASGMPVVSPPLSNLKPRKWNKDDHKKPPTYAYVFDYTIYSISYW